MFLRNHLIFLFLKFLWWGLIFGLFNIVCGFVKKWTKRNVYVHNLVSFCFWLAFGFVYYQICINHYSYQFCWFGLLGMLFGLFLVKISIDFFFTNFARLLYNKFAKRKSRKNQNGELQTS